MNHSLTASSPVSKRLSPRKMAFITGTLLLTSTGFICRILGFFYRIFMSRTIGAEGLGDLQYGTPHIQHLFRCLRRLHPDRPVAVRGCQPDQGQGRIQDGSGHCHGHVLSPGLGHLWKCRFPGRKASAGTKMRPLSAGDGSVCSLCSPPRLYQRLLLRHAESPCPRLFPGGGAGHTHGRRVPHRQHLAGIRTPDYGKPGCIRTPDW